MPKPQKKPVVAPATNAKKKPNGWLDEARKAAVIIFGVIWLSEQPSSSFIQVNQAGTWLAISIRWLG
jgi:hypothetical protein